MMASSLAFDHFSMAVLTPSTRAVANCCCLKGSAPYWSNPLFLIFNVQAPWHSVPSARAPECQNGALEQYGAEAFEQLHFGTAGSEGFNVDMWLCCWSVCSVRSKAAANGFHLTSTCALTYAFTQVIGHTSVRLTAAQRSLRSQPT